MNASRGGLGTTPADVQTKAAEVQGAECLFVLRGGTDLLRKTFWAYVPHAEIIKTVNLGSSWGFPKHFLVFTRGIFPSFKTLVIEV